MLRDQSLIPLSRQHHNGLALGILGRRALAEGETPETVARRVIDYFEVEFANHLAIEEQVLFPLCGKMPVVDDLRAEHREMERLIDRLRVEPSGELLEQFFTLLTGHIRREEREFFEEIQRELPREALDHAGTEIERRVVRVCL